MLDGVFHSPTVFYFGRDADSMVGNEVARHSRTVLLHYGNSSFKKHGLHARVTASLKSAGVVFIELGGVQPNPRAELVYRGIELCRKNNIDFVLAAGGGSVIDSAKAIGIGVPWDGDFFDFFEEKRSPTSSLKVGAILTAPGSGSESSCSAVITHEAKGLKFSCGTPLMTPVFSIMNPATTFTLDAYNTSCGIADAVSHILERYFTNTTYVDCTDRICEGLLGTLIKYALLVKDEPDNYDVRAEIMWACKLAHDNTAGFGRKQDWATHTISHAVGAAYDLPHGALVSVLFPAWMRRAQREKPDRFVQIAERVFDAMPGGLESPGTAVSAIDSFQLFLRKIGMPSSLRELGIPDRSRFAEIAANCARRTRSGTIGNFIRLSAEDIIGILECAY